MADRLHPLGLLRQDLTYSQVYDWFNCMEIGPCAGWMNSNSTLRKITTNAANQLSNVLKKIAKKAQYIYQNSKLLLKDMCYPHFGNGVRNEAISII